MENLKPIYEPKPGKKMRIVVLFSGGASAVPFIMRGEGYEVVGGISSSKNAPGISKLENLGIPVEVVDIHDFYGRCPITDMKVRESYDRKLIATIEKRGWNPDIIACSGYMYILTPVFLNRFPNRVLNVHPADLSIEENGHRKYTGTNAVKAQLEAGERVTRSTVHIMVEEADQGPILVVSGGLPVEGRNAEEQQALMKEKCDGPAYREALRLLSEGRFAIDSERNVYIRKDGKWEKRFIRLPEEMV